METRTYALADDPAFLDWLETVDSLEGDPPVGAQKSTLSASLEWLETLELDDDVDAGRVPARPWNPPPREATADEAVAGAHAGWIRPAFARGGQIAAMVLTFVMLIGLGATAAAVVFHEQVSRILVAP